MLNLILVVAMVSVVVEVSDRWIEQEDGLSVEQDKKQYVEQGGRRTLTESIEGSII